MTDSMTCPCRELQELRDYKAHAEKRLKEQEQDLLNLSRRCAALAETLRARIKEGKG